MPAVVAKQTSGRNEINVHRGNILWVITNIQHDPEATPAAYVQNAHDKHARHVTIIINAERKTLHAYDDGIGASMAEIEKIWDGVGQSLKHNDPDALGRMGLDKLLGLSISDQQVWTTRPINQKGSQYFRITIDKSDLHGNVAPTYRWDSPLLNFNGFGDVRGLNFKPNTLIMLKGLSASALRTLSNVADVADYINDKYGPKLVQSGMVVTLIYRSAKGDVINQLKPQSFPGTPQKLKPMATRFGSVHFELFTTSQRVPKPKLTVLHCGKNGFPLQNLKGLWTDVRDVLGTGNFQGIIHVDFCALLADRSGFEHGDDFDAFSQVVREFVAEEAAVYLADLKNRGREKKHEEIIRNLVERLDKYLGSNETLRLDGMLQGFVSSSHVDATQGTPTKDTYRARAPKWADVVPPKEQREKGKAQAKPDPKPHPGNEQKNKTHSSAQHSEGYIRHAIKGQFGITVATRTPDDKTGYTWNSRVEKGIIYLNVEHAQWREAERAGDSALFQYCWLHVCKELAMLSTSFVNEREHFRRIFENRFMAFAVASYLK